MKPARSTVGVVLFGGVVAMLSPPAVAQEALGLDHIPLVVRDLEVARTRFIELGFALKPGRDHTNGIRNLHVKFPDGAGIELLTASRALDPLSTQYMELLRAGEGPAFVSLHARDTPKLQAALKAGGYEFRQEGELTELRRPELSYLFFVRDNRSPSDRPEHFAHPNGATALGAVWIAPEDDEALVRLLVRLGGTQRRQQVWAPDPVEATIVSLPGGEIFILPKRHQLLAGRPVIGASFRAPDLSAVRKTLAKAKIEPWRGTGTNRVVVAPNIALGLWLEFRTGP